VLTPSYDRDSSSSSGEESPASAGSSTVVVGLNALAVQLETSDMPHGPGSASVNSWVHTGALSPSVSAALLRLPDAAASSISSEPAASPRVEGPAEGACIQPPLNRLCDAPSDDGRRPTPANSELSSHIFDRLGVQPRRDAQPRRLGARVFRGGG
jgi:hypothetical protein